jgi:hypothetical protein
MPCWSHVDIARMTDVPTRISNTAFIAVLSRFCRLSAAYRRDGDRRARCRFYVEEGAVPFVARGAARTARGSLINISSSGAQMVVDQALPAEAPIEVTFSVGGAAYRHPAWVVRTTPEQGRLLLTVRFESDGFEGVGDADVD